jgi:hypothetical protein
VYLLLSDDFGILYSFGKYDILFNLNAIILLIDFIMLSAILVYIGLVVIYYIIV